MNDLQETYDAKGLTVLSVTGESRELVDPWVEKHGATYPILCKGGAGSYSSGGVPTAYLIGPDGTVLWHDHPGRLSDSDVEEYLRDVDKKHRVTTWAFMIARALPPLPDKMSSVRKLLEKMKFGAALKKVESTLPKLEGEDAEAGEKVREWIANTGTTALEKAATQVRDGQVYKGFLTYEEIEDRFKGHDLGKQAKAAIKELKSDKQMSLEIKATEKWEAIKKEMAEEKKPADKLKVLKPILSKKYRETSAGKEAAKIAEDLERKAGK